MAVALDTSASNVSAVSSTTVSTTMTPGVLTNACAVVIVSWEATVARTVASVKLDATTAFTRLNGVTSTMDGSPCGSDLWYLVGAGLTNASHTFDVTMSGNAAAKFMVVATWQGVDQTTPLAGFVSTVVDITSPTTISPTGGTASEQMMGALMNVDGAGTQTPAVGTNTTILGAVRKETAFDGAVFIGGYGAGNAASLNFTYVGVVATECIGAVIKAVSAGTKIPQIKLLHDQMVA